jgi:hypothetical protein
MPTGDECDADHSERFDGATMPPPTVNIQAEPQSKDVGPMRCMACGAEMILMKAVEDDTMAVSGFERRTFMCSVCYDIEQRLAFNKHGRERDTEIVPVLTEQPIVLKAPPIAPASTAQNQRAAGRGFLRCALAKIRGH